MNALRSLLPAALALAATLLPLSKEAATQKAREIGRNVEELRGLTFRKPVAVEVVDDATARKHFTARLAKFLTAEQMANQARAHAHLGLLPEGTDVTHTLLDLLEEQAGGYYDPDSDTFFILSDMPPAIAPMLMAHELTHAVDDQRYGIDTLLAEAVKNDDRSTALSSVVEGSGMLVMSIFMAREMAAGRLTAEALAEMQASQAGQAAKVKKAPALLQRMLLAPYMLGPNFLTRGDLASVRAGLPRENIDRAFQDPPTSSEQILHPEKYWTTGKRDLPRSVAVPDLSPAIGDGWKRATEGTLGELYLALLTGAPTLDVTAFDAALPQRWTTTAAAGWGGDVYYYFTDGKGGVTVLATVWDSESDAQEFEVAVGKHRPTLRVSRRRDAVVVVAGDAGKKAAELAARALDTLISTR